MTSRERVRRAALFQGPDRVPVVLPAPTAVGHTDEKIKAMCEEFVAYGASVYRTGGILGMP